MASETEPRLGQWYRHLDKGQEFEVVTVSDDDGVVEIQHFDGDIEAFELEEWQQLHIEAIEPPENWTGPYDEMDEAETWFADSEMSRKEWDENLNELDSGPA